MRCPLTRLVETSFFGFAFVHAQRDRGRVRELVGKAVRDNGIRGIKVHRSESRITREVCEVARAASTFRYCTT